MFKQLKPKRAFALILTLALCAGMLAGCGGQSDGISNGRYEPTNPSMATFTYFDFSGGKVEVGTGVAGMTVSSQTVNWTLKDGNLKFELGGTAVEVPCEVVNENTLNISGQEYVKGGSQEQAAATSSTEDDGSAVAASVTFDWVAPTEYDGVYVQQNGQQFVVSNGEFEFYDVNGNITEFTYTETNERLQSGKLRPDGSTGEITINYVTYGMIPKFDSFFSETHSQEYVKTGGKNIAQHELDNLFAEQMGALPAISLKHQYDDSRVLQAGEYGECIVDTAAATLVWHSYYSNGSLSEDFEMLSENPILADAKRIFFPGGYSSLYFILTNNNELWGMGKNDQGQLGDGTGVDKDDFVHIADDVVDLYFDADYGRQVYAFKSDDSLWRWGDGFGENRGDAYEPVFVANDVAEVGKKAGVLLKTNGDIVRRNADGAYEVWLQKVKNIFHTEGNRNAYVIFSDDSLYYYPNLFNSGTLTIDNLEREHLFDNASEVYTGYLNYSTEIVKTLSGALYGRGQNSNGQLGDGTKIDKEDWVLIAEGVARYDRDYIGDPDTRDDNYDYYYEKTDGSIWAWDASDPTPAEIVPAVGALHVEENDAEESDAGTTDVGTTDVGATDAGATDAGATDAGATDAEESGTQENAADPE